MATYYSKVVYSASGGSQGFTVPFPYILKEHVSVSVNGAVQVEGVGYTWVTTSLISLSATAGDSVVIRRRTPIAARLTDYQDGVTLTESDLDTDSTQAFYLIQEFLDDLTDGVVNGIDITTIINNLSNPRFFGGLASDPTVNPITGSALVIGDAYYNTTSLTVRVWGGSAWDNVTSRQTLGIPDYLLQNVGIL